MINIYQIVLQTVVKNISPKYRFYQATLQTVIRQLTPKYNISQVALQTLIRQFNLPQHAQYVAHQIPLELAYRPDDYITFDYCEAEGYFFSADHNIILYEGETLTVRLIGGVPPYTWALDVGSNLILASVTTTLPVNTLTASTFVAGIEYLTVEDACGAQLTICVSMCKKIVCVDWSCVGDFSCEDSCTRGYEPPPPPPPPPFPPGDNTYNLITGIRINGIPDYSGIAGTITPGSSGHESGDEETVIFSVSAGYTFIGWDVSQGYSSDLSAVDIFNAYVQFYSSDIFVYAEVTFSAPPPLPPPPGTITYILTTAITVNGELVTNGEGGTITPGASGYVTGDEETVILLRDPDYTFDRWEVTQSFVETLPAPEEHHCDVIFASANITVIAHLLIDEEEREDKDPFTFPHELLDGFADLEIIIISAEGDRETYYLLWNLVSNTPHFGLGDAITSKADWDKFYGKFFELNIVPDNLSEGASVGLPTINKWNSSGPALTLGVFGYPVQPNTEWGCGNTFTKALFAPMWCEDSGTVVFGSGGGVNWGGDYYDACNLMEPWASQIVTVSGATRRGDDCDLTSFHNWPAGINRDDHYNYKSSLSQVIMGEMDFYLTTIKCPPWNYAEVLDSALRVSVGRTDRSLWVIDTAIGAHTDHGYISANWPSDSGDWGSVALEPTGDYNLFDHGFVRTKFDYICSEVSYSSTMLDGSAGCQDYDEGSLGPFNRTQAEPAEMGAFQYYTWWGSIGITFVPTMGHTLEENTGHRVWRSVEDWEFQAHIFVRQRTENRRRKIDVHGTIGKDIKGLPPMLTGRYGLLEDNIKSLLDNYYFGWKTDNYLPGSKIDPSLKIKVYRATFKPLVKCYQLPLEVAFEKT